MKNRFVPDIFSWLLVLAFAVNLVYFLECRHTNISRIDERDRHTQHDPGSGAEAEQERIRRGEEEQELRDPSQAKISHRNMASGVFKGWGEAKGRKGSPGATGGDAEGIADEDGWLCNALSGEDGRRALQQMDAEGGHLKLTAEQEKWLASRSDTEKKLHDLMAKVLSYLRPEQVKFLLSNREKIDHLADTDSSLDKVVDIALQKLSLIKEVPTPAFKPFTGDAGLWSPTPIAVGIAMLAENKQYEYQLSMEQALWISEALISLTEVDNQRQAREAESGREMRGILNEDQIEFLNIALRKLKKK